jgi:hypothetical protein
MKYTYDEQIAIIQAAKDGKTISGRKIGESKWTTHCDRVKHREIYYTNKYVRFNFQDYEYRIE